MVNTRLVSFLSNQSTSALKKSPVSGIMGGVESKLAPRQGIFSSSSLSLICGWERRASSSTSSTKLQVREFSASRESVYGSSRGREAVALLPTYLADARSVEKFSPTNREGALQLGVAESQLLEDLLVPAISAGGPLGADCIYYQATHGRESLRKEFAKYLERLLELDGKLNIDGLVVGTGCNAVLENLCLCLAEVGDTVLIPTPYYAAFEFDLVARAGLAIQPVKTMEYQSSDQGKDGSIPAEAYYPTRAALDAACEQALANGSEARVLLLSHPQNPLGISYPPEVVKECIDWCREHQIHLVSDEIYAGSIYRGAEAGFVSALKLAGSSDDVDSEENGLGLGPFIHFVYALSKDFALSGLRVGAAYTENKEIQLPFQKLNDLCQISSQTQVLVEGMLSKTTTDDSSYWTEHFRGINHSRLIERGNALHDCLNELDIPFLPGTSGLFVWIDMTQFLPLEGEPEERERQLYLQLMHDYGLLLTPGLSMRNERPGFFRCVFTAASNEEFEIALERFRKFGSKAPRYS